MTPPPCDRVVLWLFLVLMLAGALWLAVNAYDTMAGAT